MTMIRKVMPAQVNALGDDEVEVIVSTGQLARDGHIFEPAGADLDNYRKNPIVLWQHDPMHPVGRAEQIQVAGDKIVARIKFAPAGVSHKADEIRGLVKSGIVSGVSVGMEPIDAEPLDPKKPRGGQRVTRWEMLECSFCSVPVDTEATVTARADPSTRAQDKAADWKVGASPDLAIEDSDSWDGAAAEKSIFEHAGGDDFDPAKARKGFLVYNAAKPKERGSYKLPIAHAVDDALKVPKGAIRAAASRLPQTDIPEDTKAAAAKVLDHYKEKAGMSDGKDKADKDRALAAARTRMLPRTFPAKPKLRSLYHVASLACTLQDLGYLHNCTAYEAEIEGDQSPVPAMLGEAMQQLGQALCTMTEEEVAELMTAIGAEAADDDEAEIETRELSDDERAFIAQGKTPRARAWRRGIAVARAGKMLSASNQKKLEQAQGHHDRALKHHRALGEHQETVGGHLEALSDAHDRAKTQLGKLGEALDAAHKASPSDDTETAQRAYRALGGQLDDAVQSRADMADAHEDLGDAHRALGRSLKAAQRAVKSVVDGSTPGEDSDSKEVQTSAGTQDDEGARSLNFRRRQAELLALTR